MSSISMSWALTHLGEGPAVITLRHRAPVVKGIGAGDTTNVVTLDELIEVRAERWKNLGEDNWELYVEQIHPQTQARVRSLWYIHGTDILMVQAQAKVVS